MYKIRVSQRHIQCFHKPGTFQYTPVLQLHGPSWYNMYCLCTVQSVLSELVQHVPFMYCPIGPIRAGTTCTVCVLSNRTTQSKIQSSSQMLPFLLFHLKFEMHPPKKVKKKEEKTQVFFLSNWDRK